MISICIMAFKEPLVGKCIDSILDQEIEGDYELIISAPDKETLEIAKRYSKKNKNIKIFKDLGKGKNYAINMLYPILKGEIIIFTDGDVYLGENSINEVLEEFKEEKIGCVTGRPIPQESKKTKYGFWANFLFDSAHRLRKKQSQRKEFLITSGYLYAYRSKIISRIPLPIADDLIVPALFWEKGFKIGYAPKALTFVKNANNWGDWVKQKVRTSKSHIGLERYVNTKNILEKKTFLNEARGIISAISYPNSIKEFYWMAQLIIARAYMWGKVFIDTKVKDNHYGDGWERIESTKKI